jgi:hypothetical protein
MQLNLDQFYFRLVVLNKKYVKHTKLVNHCEGIYVLNP